jgi:nicotinate phosphoribosyltransferase
MNREFERKLRGEIPRLTNETFQFDPRVGQGWYSAAYFLKTQKIVSAEKGTQNITLQFFQRSVPHATLCGMDESIALLETFSPNFRDLHIMALQDGDEIAAYEPVLQVTGPYAAFGFLEGVIDGVLARRTSVASNVCEILRAAGDHPVIFMGDRDDHFLQQQGDGYAAFIGGITAQCTLAMNEWWGQEGVGTMPHALIQNFGGDVVAASKAYVKHFPTDKLVTLVDYRNDVITDSLLLAQEFGEKLYAVRVDTSEYLIDQSLQNQPNAAQLKGVSAALIFKLRKALDEAHFRHVKIVVSGGFHPQKIKQFIADKVPVDMYGVGSSLLKLRVSFTGDCVKIDGKPEAKVGRQFFESERLKKVL